MTDAEAKKALESEIRVQSRGTEADVVPALRHALVALADRAALVESWRGFLTYEADLRSKKWLPTDDAMHAARRHMRGEEG